MSTLTDCFVLHPQCPDHSVSSGAMLKGSGLISTTYVERETEKVLFGVCLLRLSLVFSGTQILPMMVAIL